MRRCLMILPLLLCPFVVVFNQTDLKRLLHLGRQERVVFSDRPNVIIVAKPRVG